MADIKTKLDEFRMMATRSKMLEAGFDHPCRETCSGWKQGKHRGAFEAAIAIERLIKALELEIESRNKLLDNIYDRPDCDGSRDAIERHDQALAKVLEGEM